RYQAYYWHVYLETRPFEQQFGNVYYIGVRSVTSVTDGDGNKWTRIELLRTHGYAAGRRFYALVRDLTATHAPDWGEEYWWARAVDSTTIEIPVESTTIGSVTSNSVVHLFEGRAYSSAATSATADFMSFDIGRPVTFRNTTQGQEYPLTVDEPSPVVVARERLSGDRYRLIIDANRDKHVGVQLVERYQ